jgi:hypothetical protein
VLTLCALQLVALVQRCSVTHVHALDLTHALDLVPAHVTLVPVTRVCPAALCYAVMCCADAVYPAAGGPGSALQV